MGDHRHGALDEDGNCVMSGVVPEYCAGCRELARRGFVDEGAAVAPRQRATWGETGGMATAVALVVAYLVVVSFVVYKAVTQLVFNGWNVVGVALVIIGMGVFVLLTLDPDVLATAEEAGHGDDA